MRRSTFICLALLLTLPAATLAQHRAGAAFTVSDPQGEFDTNTDTGYGFAAWYRYHLGGGFAIGVDGAFQIYGSTERRVPLSPTIPEIQVEIETTNNTTYIQGALELAPTTTGIQPYGLVTGGFGFFYTTSSLQDPETEETILSDTNQSDWTWVYGLGGGLRIPVREIPREERLPMRLMLDVGASWLSGGEVEYLREGTLVTDDGEFDIDSRLARSEIELISYRIGLSVEF